MKFPWAYPGAKIVCIDEEFDRIGFRPLKAGAEYTIVRLLDPPRNCPKHKLYYGSVLSVIVKGLPRWGFAIERFRPPINEVEKLKQSIKAPRKKELVQ